MSDRKEEQEEHDRRSQPQGTTSVGFAYDAANRLTSTTLPDQIVETYGYDAATEPTAITYTKGASTLGGSRRHRLSRSS